MTDDGISSRFHDSFVCDVTYSCTIQMSHESRHVTHGRWVMNLVTSQMSHESRHVTHRIQMSQESRDVTHERFTMPYMSFICDMTHLHVTWRMHMCMRITSVIWRMKKTHFLICDMTHLYATWRIHVCIICACESRGSCHILEMRNDAFVHMWHEPRHAVNDSYCHTRGMSHTNESSPTWMIHVTNAGVILHMHDSCYMSPQTDMSPHVWHDSFIWERRSEETEKLTTAKMSNKFSREPPYLSNTFSRESPKFQYSFSVE